MDVSYIPIAKARRFVRRKAQSKRTGSFYGRRYTQIFSEKLHQIRYAENNNISARKVAKTKRKKQEGRKMTDKNKSIYAPYFEKNDEPFFMKIGNTTYKVSTHFNPNGKENVLQQFQKLILPEKSI